MENTSCTNMKHNLITNFKMFQKFIKYSIYLKTSHKFIFEKLW